METNDGGDVRGGPVGCQDRMLVVVVQVRSSDLVVVVDNRHTASRLSVSPPRARSTRWLGVGSDPPVGRSLPPLLLLPPPPSSVSFVSPPADGVNIAIPTDSSSLVWVLTGLTKRRHLAYLLTDRRWPIPSVRRFADGGGHEGGREVDAEKWKRRARSTSARVVLSSSRSQRKISN
jgi:hypothetical protein